MAVVPKKPADEMLRARAEGRTYTTEQLGERAKQLEGRVAQLRNRYDQFFMGLDRKSPAGEREALHKEIEQLRQFATKNTALNFRLNSLFNRFLTFERMWARTERDIEDGRYRPDILKARRHLGQSPAPARQGSVPAGAAPGDGPSEARLHAIYDAYITAKKECSEPTAGLSFEQVAERLRRQVPDLLKKVGGAGVDFKVVIKDGKAQLRAVAKG